MLIIWKWCMERIWRRWQINSGVSGISAIVSISWKISQFGHCFSLRLRLLWNMNGFCEGLLLGSFGAFSSQLQVFNWSNIPEWRSEAVFKVQEDGNISKGLGIQFCWRIFEDFVLQLPWLSQGLWDRSPASSLSAPKPFFFNS